MKNKIRHVIFALVFFNLFLYVLLYIKLFSLERGFLIENELIGFNLYFDFGFFMFLIFGSGYVYTSHSFGAYYKTKIADIADILIPIIMLVTLMVLGTKTFP